ncbi:hypothetical protein Dimus_018385, partial [Dionaea muscipula]
GCQSLWLLSSGGLAPPSSPCRRRFLWGDNLTQPRRHRSLVEDCQRALKTVNPRLVWSYDSRRHRDSRVRAVVERTLEEEAGSNRDVHRPDLGTSLQGPSSIEASRTSMASSPDLFSSTEVVTSMVENPQVSSISTGDGDGEYEGFLPVVTEEVAVAALVDGAFPVAEAAMADGDSEKDAIGDGQEPAGVGLPAAASQIMIGVAASELDSGHLVSVGVLCGDVVSDGTVVGSGMGRDELLLISASPVEVADLASDQEGVNDADQQVRVAELPRAVPLLDVDGGQGVDELGSEKDSQFLPVDGGLVADHYPAPVCPSPGGGGLPGVPFHPLHVAVCSSQSPASLQDDCYFIGGLVSVVDSLISIHEGELVREEVMVTPAARATLRPQPTDGLRQPPLSSVEPGCGGHRVWRGPSGGRLAPPTSPRRRRRHSLDGDNLTQPRRHRNFMEDYRRALRVVNPRLVWSYDSLRHRDLQGEMRDSIEVLRLDLGLSSLSGIDLQQVDGGEVSPTTDWREGVDAIGCSDLVPGGGSGLNGDELSCLSERRRRCCSGYRRMDGWVGDGVWQPAVVDYGVGGADSEQEVEVGAGRAALVMPTESVCSSFPSLYASAADVIADGFVRVEVRASSTTKEALRPQPTDGLWQPPSSPMVLVSEREEMEKVVCGGV